MPKPRCHQVSLEATPYYHCVSRCVRRAFLCGSDPVTGNNYEHRRQLIEDKLLALSTIFAIDVCSYAIMSNYYHVVLHINQHQAESWCFDEVISRWHQLFKGNLFSKRYMSKIPLSKSELTLLTVSVNKWRVQLMDISWFMRVLNETTAREANKEDKCTGRFWEGHFYSQALLDEPALASCMAYVDLNPIRAKMASSVEDSAHTSIKKRIEHLKNSSAAISDQTKNLLFPFAGNPNKNSPEGLLFKLEDYLELVDLTGRIIRDDKRGFVSSRTLPILNRLNIEAENWVYLAKHFESKFKGLVGSVSRLKVACKILGYKRTCFLSSCEAFFT